MELLGSATVRCTNQKEPCGGGRQINKERGERGSYDHVAIVDPLETDEVYAFGFEEIGRGFCGEAIYWG